MFSKMKNLRSLVIVISCVLFAGAFVPKNLSAETVIEEWVAMYQGSSKTADIANSMAVDAAGNVYVTGQSWSDGASYDYATIKYSPNGTQLWVARYDGPVHQLDTPHDIVVDTEGNVYVTGQSYGVDLGDYATIKYDTNGTQLWVARYNGPGVGGQDNAQDIALDASGNVYVTGFCNVSTADCDYATVKYDPNGNELWVVRYDGPTHTYDYATAMAVDAAGNVCVTGKSFSATSSFDYATVKYDTNGNEQWVARYVGTAENIPHAIVLGEAGNVYVTGETWGSGAYDFATVKYDADGNQQWVAQFNGTGDAHDRASDLAVDASGNVYVTGFSYGSGTGGDFATIKYDAIGNQLWVARYNGPGNYYDSPCAIALDTFGNIYVSGDSSNSNTLISADYATVKYDPSGNQLWVARYNDPDDDHEQASDMAVDGFGNVYITGHSYGTSVSSPSVYATIKYSQDPAKAIEELVAAVISLNLQKGISNSLDAKLGAALNALDDVNTNNNVAAINTLEAFISSVEAQRGKEISETDADVLIQMAVNILNMLSGT